MRLRWILGFGAITLQWLVGPATHPALVVACTILLLTIGMGHGGLDLWLVRRADPENSNIATAVKYIVAMALMAGLWFVSPSVAFGLFLLLSAYHFGEVRDRGVVLATTHGAFVIGVAASSRPEAAAQILRALGFESVAVPAPWMWLMVHMAAIAVVAGRRGPTQSIQTEVIDSVVIFFLISTLHPVVGFLLYFTLWHATDHLADIRASWGDAVDSVFELVRAAAPTTLVSIAGLIALLVWTRASSNGDWPAAIANLFFVLSLLTLPHAFVVTWARGRARSTAEATTSSDARCCRG